jgi:hypothetical protein
MGIEATCMFLFEDLEGFVWELVERRGMKGIGVEEFPL